MNIKKIFLIAVFLGQHNFCSAENFITLDFMLEEAKKSNPEIKILQNKYLSSRQKVFQSTTLEYPLVGYETGTIENVFSISQMFPFPGKLSLRKQIAESDSKIIEQELNSKTREILSAVKKSYWEYWLIHKTLEIYQENIDLMKRFLNIAKTQYALGKVTQIDILKANTELSEMERMLIMWEQEKISTQAELNGLLNRPADEPIGSPVQPQQKEVKLTLKDLEGITLKNNPALLTKASFYNSKMTGLKLSKREWFPDVMAGIKSSNIGNQTYMVQTTLPVYFWKQSSIVQMMRNEKEMAEWEFQSTKVEISKLIRDLFAKCEAHKNSTEIYQTNILPLAEQTLTLTESGYRTGKNSFLDLLDSQKRYLSYKIDYYRHMTETQIYLIELEKIVGVDFE